MGEIVARNIGWIVGTRGGGGVGRREECMHVASCCSSLLFGLSMMAGICVAVYGVR